MSAVTIDSADDLFAFITLAQAEPSFWELLDIEKLSVIIPIKILGPGRDGRIDVAGAIFIQNLDRHIKRAAKEYGEHKLSSKHIALRVKIVKGCDKGLADFSECIKEAFKKMESRHLAFFLTIACLCGTGYLTFAKFEEASIEKMKLQIQAASAARQLEHEENVLELFQKTTPELQEIGRSQANEIQKEDITNGNDPFYPIREYSKSLADEEKIAVGTGPARNKNDTLELLMPLADNSTIHHVGADGVYELMGLDLIGGKQALKLKQGPKNITAFLERLDDHLKDEIIRAVGESIDQNTTVSRNLQLNAYFSQNKLMHGAVLGVGNPRPDFYHYHMKDIPENTTKENWVRQGE